MINGSSPRSGVEERRSRPSLGRRRSRVNNIRRDRDHRFPPEPSFLPSPRSITERLSLFVASSARSPSTPIPLQALPDEQLGDELVRASTGWNVIIFVRFLATAALPLLAVGGGMKLFSTSADGIYTRIISLFSFPSRLFQTTILLKRSGKTMGKYENILDQGKSIVIFDDQRERERVLWRE